MSRIEDNDTIEEVVVKMAERNSGSLTAIIKLMRQDGILSVAYLDALGIYGADIYILWSDQCGQDTAKFRKLLEATRMGLFPKAQLIRIAKDQMGKHLLSEDELDAVIKSISKEIKMAATAASPEPMAKV